MHSSTGRRQHARRRANRLGTWAGLALGSLLLAGLFSLLLVLGRMPPFAEWLPYPAFFRRCLVVHVDLALVVWFYAAVAGLLQFLPLRPQFELLDRWSPSLAFAGVGAMVATIFVPTADPVLANYVPVLDAPIFLVGLGLFTLAILAVVATRRPRTPETDEGASPAVTLPDASRIGLWGTAAALTLAVATVAVAWVTTPFDLPAPAYYERLFWGGGHVLQVASVCAMMAVWIALLSSYLQRPVVGPTLATGLFAWLVVPHLANPVFAAGGTETALYRAGATRLMEFGIFPPVVATMAWIAFDSWQNRPDEPRGEWFDLRLVGFLASAALTLVGFLIGAMIHGSSTMVPAHYHASIGAVTVAFMTFGLHLLERRHHTFAHPGLRRLVPWQPLLFGFGQLVFVVGFALAGSGGMGRKLFGSDQLVLGWTDYVGLVVMGAGGLAAIAGGLTFLVLVADQWLLRSAEVTRAARLDPSSVNSRTPE